MKQHNFYRYHYQTGASTLTIVLLLLVVLMLPTVASLRRTQTNEQLLAASMDRARVFQAAEAALVEAEAFAATKPEAPTSGCSGGVCAIPNGAPPWETNTNFWNNGGASILAQARADGVTTRYVIEFLGVSTGASDDCTTGGDVSPDAHCDMETSRYRVTVRSISDTQAEVLLQSNFLAP